MENLNLMKECKDAKKIGITGHIRPDGDCIGATLALYQYLIKLLPESEVVVHLERPAVIFKNIKGYEFIQVESVEDIEYDIFFVLDTGKDRIGQAKKYFDKAKKTINIDHHISNKGSCDINYIKPNVSSASEMIYEILEEDKIDSQIAEAIYIGMIHDTGVFQYSNTTSRTLEIASKLISFGFDFSNIIDTTFYEKTFEQTKILGHALLKSERLLEGKCVVSVITQKDFILYQIGAKDLDGIVNQLAKIKGVACAIFMYEMEKNQYKVSMRSSSEVNVSQIASFFGGGGHVKAAGCTLKGTSSQIVEQLITKIQSELKEVIHD